MKNNVQNNKTRHSDFANNVKDVADMEDYLSSELSRIDKYVLCKMAKQLFLNIFKKVREK